MLKDAVEKGIVDEDNPNIKEYVDKITDYIIELIGSIYDRGEIEAKIYKAFSDELGFEIQPTVAAADLSEVREEISIE